MPVALLLLVVQITLVVHAAKTGRFSPWGYILIFLPVAGAVAYVVVELIPEWFGSAQGQRARGRVVKALDPERRYRALSDQFASVDTIGTRGALAEECLVLGKHWAALEHFNEILTRPMGDEPIYMLGRARAEFGLGKGDHGANGLRIRHIDTESLAANL